MRDIAHHAGVSVATVSRILNDAYRAPAPTHRKVMDAVQSLGYRTTTTKALTSLSGTVAIGVPHMRSVFYLEAAAGIEEEAAALGLAVLIGTTGADHARELAFVDLMAQRSADAVILVGGVNARPEHDEALAQRAASLARTGARLVLCGRPWEGPPGALVQSVNFDSEAGAFAATAYLLSFGHRRIAHIGGSPDHITFRRREQGYRRALAAFDVEVDPALISTGQPGRDGGFAQARALLATTDVTAIFVVSDETAAGVLAAARAAGRSVPEDLSVVGFDDIPLARDLYPALTTVHVPLLEVGRMAARMAMPRAQVAGSGPAAEQHITVGTHVVVRDSVAIPPALG